MSRHLGHRFWKDNSHIIYILCFVFNSIFFLHIIILILVKQLQHRYTLFLHLSIFFIYIIHTNRTLTMPGRQLCTKEHFEDKIFVLVYQQNNTDLAKSASLQNRDTASTDTSKWLVL